MVAALQSKTTLEDLELHCNQLYGLDTVLQGDNFRNLRSLRLGISGSSARLDWSSLKFPRLQTLKLTNNSDELFRLDLSNFKELKAVSVRSLGEVSMDLGAAVGSLQVLSVESPKLEAVGDLSTLSHLVLGSRNRLGSSVYEIAALVDRCVSLKSLALMDFGIDRIAIPSGLETLVLRRTIVDELELHHPLKTLLIYDSEIRTPPAKLWATHLYLYYAQGHAAFNFGRLFARTPDVLGSPRSLTIMKFVGQETSLPAWNGDVVGKLLTHQAIRHNLEFLATNFAIKSPLPTTERLGCLWLGNVDGLENVQQGNHLTELVLDCNNQTKLDRVAHLLPGICKSVVLPAGMELPAMEGLTVESRPECDMRAGKMWSTYVEQPWLDYLFLSKSADGQVIGDL